MIGFIVAKLKYLRSVAKHQKTKEVERPVQATSNAMESLQLTSNTEADCDFLQSVVINAENMAEIKQKLKATEEYRDDLIDNKNMELVERFPYFYSNPELVSTKPMKKFACLFFYYELL